MQDRPILFSGPMVRAILAGKKTQTRRVVKAPQWAIDPDMRLMSEEQNDPFPGLLCATAGDKEWHPVPCPYGQPGDRLWVRETWGCTRQCDDINGPGDVIAYAAGGEHVYEDVNGKRRLRLTQRGTVMQPNHFCWPPEKWKPSIHMPRWASRITLEVTDVRVERLNDISGRDVLAEGIDNGSSNPANGERWENMQRMAFEDLWTSINGAGSWAANPWVWCVCFKRVTP